MFLKIAALLVAFHQWIHEQRHEFHDDVAQGHRAQESYKRMLSARRLEKAQRAATKAAQEAAHRSQLAHKKYLQACAKAREEQVKCDALADKSADKAAGALTQVTKSADLLRLINQ